MTAESEIFKGPGRRRRLGQPRVGLLTLLRAGVPERPLSAAEAAHVAEWQADTLLRIGGVVAAPAPEDLIASLPRVSVRIDGQLPVSATAHWADGRWLILLNGREPRTRQRFSLAHEFKHVIDHRDWQLLYAPRSGRSAQQQAEEAADYFAACLLVPRRWLQRAWDDGVHDIAALSRLFAVSPQAMIRRLDTVGLSPGATASGAWRLYRRRMGTRRAA